MASYTSAASRSPVSTSTEHAASRASCAAKASPSLARPARGPEKKRALAERALDALVRWRDEGGLAGTGTGSASVA